jgi:DNA-binding protein H-NS
MTETLKQWKRRAEKAEAELEIIQRMRAFDKNQEMVIARENAALRVAIREIQDTTNWAYGAIADKLGSDV